MAETEGCFTFRIAFVCGVMRSILLCGLSRAESPQSGYRRRFSLRIKGSNRCLPARIANLKPGELRYKHGATIIETVEGIPKPTKCAPRIAGSVCRPRSHGELVPSGSGFEFLHSIVACICFSLDRRLDCARAGSGVCGTGDLSRSPIPPGTARVAGCGVL